MPNIITPPDWPRPRGYNHGLMARGQTLSIAGQIGIRPKTGSFRAGLCPQMRQALENILEVVATAGGEPKHIMSATIFVTDMRQYTTHTKDVGVAWRALMGKHYPALTLVEVSRLMEPDALVEIQATAVLPE